MAQAQRLGDLPQRPAGRMQAADRLVIVHLGPVGGMLRHREVLLGALGLAHQLLVKPHLSSVARQRATGLPSGEWSGRPSSALRAIDPYGAAAILADLRPAPRTAI